ncbi:adenylyltransferase/cytidyltransferase family protein [Microbulbifer thermotolerans]|uniref:adenylyltransferase/cytidyltransferase family protein n=1 Tax=Microbulbifer thermotolerans TaxID=252514 RepID=UPI00224B2E3F|nr:adenylyltransferase/cytidyltransferase family protein [Microbulbifer thermotolerans]MCX2782480.1 adenylyltransferase/cytidyltransferase family protein [Microbulbifer thermotolerans]MCX2836196.1 adenylyltransferase/cytidyltransferase family protein [Microbulbifer thermotolerans]
MRVITFGTFDVFHIGHVNILERAKELGSYLIVGVSSDQLNIKKKGRPPIYSQSDRLKIVESLHCVDKVFLEESLEKKAEYIKLYKADILVMGSDWEGKFDQFKSICDVQYFPRTEGISTSQIIDIVKHHVEV